MMYIQRISVLSLLVLGAVFVGSSAEAVDYRSPTVQGYTFSGEKVLSFDAYDALFKGGGEVVVADVLSYIPGDEIIVGAGRGGGPHVRVFDASGKWTGYGFFPFHPDFRGGIDVAVGDTDGDGVLELITSQAAEGQAWVKVYEFDPGRTINAEFIAFSPSFLGGAHVAAGDIDGDGTAEVLVGSGLGGSSHVRAFTNSGVWTGFELFPFEPEYKGGVDISAGNTDGGLDDEILVSKASFGTAQVKLYNTDAEKHVYADFLAVPEAHTEGVHVAMGDFDDDPLQEIVVGTGGNGPQVLTFQPDGSRMDFSEIVYEADFRGGVNVAAGNLTSASGDEIFTMPSRRVWLGRPGVYKYVDVNLTEQHLYAYEAGRVVFDFPISSGTEKYPTPTGDYEILSKNPLQDYRWEYGLDHPDNYDIPDVPWNMRFSGPYFLHAAFWHNNFGNPMSHGCVNISVPNAEKTYKWINVGDKVFIHY